MVRILGATALKVIGVPAELRLRLMALPVPDVADGRGRDSVITVLNPQTA